MSSFSKSSDGQRPSGPSRQDLSPSSMKDLLGSEVTGMRQAERPLGSSTRSSSSSSSVLAVSAGVGLSHSGTEVVTADGGHWLVHKGGNFGREKGGNTVITDARNMSGNWKPTSGWTGVNPGTRVTDLIREGGKDYGLLTSNCHMATNAISKKFGSGK